MNKDKPKHTRLPYDFHIFRYPNGELNGTPYIYAGNGPDAHRHVASVFLDPEAAKEVQEMQEETGRFIARACNSHYDLLRGCEAAMAYLVDPRSKHRANRIVAADIIRAAIRKARGEL